LTYDAQILHFQPIMLLGDGPQSEATSMNAIRLLPVAVLLGSPNTPAAHITE